ncbi:hypothetical protein DV735_g1117, partial [Chaetothyriales sp. CBS 134920]
MESISGSASTGRPRFKFWGGMVLIKNTASKMGVEARYDSYVLELKKDLCGGYPLGLIDDQRGGAALRGRGRGPRYEELNYTYARFWRRDPERSSPTTAHASKIWDADGASWLREEEYMAMT